MQELQSHWACIAFSCHVSCLEKCEHPLLVCVQQSLPSAAGLWLYALSRSSSGELRSAGDKQASFAGVPKKGHLALKVLSLKTALVIAFREVSPFVLAVNYRNQTSHFHMVSIH